MGSIERTSADDLLHLTYDQKPCTAQVGAILLLEPGKRLEVDVLRAAVADRVAGIPRLRQQLRHAPRGCGRPVWVDDPAFDLSRHITSARCPEPQDERALLDLAAALITTALPPDRPLWSATLVAFQHERCAIVIVLHHVIADGLGALTVLAGLVDRLAGAP
ncbi:MAG: hypothetical protein JXA67_10315, partial [Micromonosporaceae bacterium]|nr:hypothetical protein [Micromonosporaceae bacterium]